MSDAKKKPKGKRAGKVMTAPAARVNENEAPKAETSVANTPQAMTPIQNAARALKEGVGDEVDRFRAAARESFSEGRRSAQQWESHIEDSMRERPLVSLLIAAGVGILLGALWSSDRRH